jgi:orotidine-5'-phosphate decarboxylase
MTELIVALDGPDPRALQYRLHEHAGVTWFKIGPQAMVHTDWPNLMRHGRNVKTFLDLKLADTIDTVTEAVKRFADAGIAAISTFTIDATAFAVSAAHGSDLRIWQVLRLTDDAILPINRLAPRTFSAHGVICPPSAASIFEGCGIDVVTPGVRLGGERHNCHLEAQSPSFVSAAGATHAVVGRPIWQAANPIAAAKAYQSALKGVPSCSPEHEPNNGK